MHLLSGEQGQTKNISVLNKISPCWKTSYVHWHFSLQKARSCHGVFPCSMWNSQWIERQEKGHAALAKQLLFRVWGGVHWDFRHTVGAAGRPALTNNRWDKRPCTINKQRRGKPQKDACWHNQRRGLQSLAQSASCLCCCLMAQPRYGSTDKGAAKSKRD